MPPLRTTLVHVAALLSAACGGSTATSASRSLDAGKDAPAGDAQSVDAEPAEAACGGCNCGGTMFTKSATPAQACALTAESGSSTAACLAFCSSADDGNSNYCNLPSDYQAAFRTANGGAPSEDGGPVCPSWSSPVIVTCGYLCLGRRTQGLADPEGSTAHPGDELARRAYLEGVSVHAFERLEREVTALGAPPSIVRSVRKARRDEIRHVAMTARLARRFGGSPHRPPSPALEPARSRVDIAIENAVEGCVRETYGAVMGLVESRTSRDREVRRALASIAADECRHAELAWTVAAWLTPRLTPREQARVREATRDAIEALARDGDPRAVALLDERLWVGLRGSAARASS